MKGNVRPNWLQNILKDLLFRHLDQIRNGSLVIREAGSSESTCAFGEPNADLRAQVTILDPRAYTQMVLGGSLGAGRSWIEGQWTADDLTSLIRIFIRSMRARESRRSNIDHGVAWLSSLSHRRRHRSRRNTIHNSRSNIASHYDLGNEFYSLWLDTTMNYSSAIFDHRGQDLRSASLAKMDRLCRLLDLEPGDRLLEIGTGWGGFAIHAAGKYGCHVTTTTISEEQFRMAKERVRAAGLEDRITVLLEDYRKLQGQFDKAVSIEMIEAVGHEFLPTYFSRVSELVRPSGRFVLQAIVIADHQHAFHRQNSDFVSHFIFPGGELPSISSLTQSAADAGRWRLVRLDTMSAHYAETLRRWKHKFDASLDEIRGMGFDDAFIRMWQYYLCYCEAAFEERQVNSIQLVLAGPECDVESIPLSAIPSLPTRGETVGEASRFALNQDAICP